jgi:hypothetical protein
MFGIDTVTKFPVTMSFAGDFNGDGYDDFVIGGQPPTNVYPFLNGLMFLFFGKATFTGDINAADLTDGNTDTSIALVFYSTDLKPVLRTPVGTYLGDINGDGFDDLSCQNLILFGYSVAPTTTGPWMPVSFFFNTHIEGKSFKLLGFEYRLGIGAAGDVNGDNWDDIYVGNIPGAAVIFGGDGEVRSPTSRPTQTAPTANPTTTHPTANPTTYQPTLAPTYLPTSAPPTVPPTLSPFIAPTMEPTFLPTYQPTANPTTFQPTANPTTFQPTAIPTAPTARPTIRPTALPTPVNVVSLRVAQVSTFWFYY